MMSYLVLTAKAVSTSVMYKSFFDLYFS